MLLKYSNGPFSISGYILIEHNEYSIEFKCRENAKCRPPRTTHVHIPISYKYLIRETTGTTRTVSLKKSYRFDRPKLARYFFYVKADMCVFFPFFFIAFFFFFLYKRIRLQCEILVLITWANSKDSRGCEIAQNSKRCPSRFRYTVVIPLRQFGSRHLFRCLGNFLILFNFFS